jgi:hypothetical protein
MRMIRRTALRAAALLPGPSADGAPLEAPRTSAPRTRFNGPITPHRRLSIGSLPLQTVKAVKNELGVTVNDVIVALCASMLRAWLHERGELPDEPLVAMVPVSVRTEAEAGTFGNRRGYGPRSKNSKGCSVSTRPPRRRPNSSLFDRD